jgi:signal transduction histidine kinase
VLTRDQLSGIRTPRFFERPVQGVAGRARLLAIPVANNNKAAVLVVGQTMSDRTDALRELLLELVIGGIAAIVAAGAAGWFVARWALRPVDRMRAEAAAITLSGMDHRLTPPRVRDELHRLAGTLNAMLGRLQSAMSAERAFLAEAGHELRTPLAALRAELDLALRRPRTREELRATLVSMSEETDRLARLADDLLLLARAADGRLPLHREDVPVKPALQSVAALFHARAVDAGIALKVRAPDVNERLDPLRVRQALVNLVDNALRHTPRGGTVRLTAEIEDGALLVRVSDTGPGFDAAARGGAGLGLRIVEAVAHSHGGSIAVGSAYGDGGCVTVRIPRELQ